MMWVIYVAGHDSGISISGRDYYDALVAAIKCAANLFGIIAEDEVDVVSWQNAGLV